MWMNWLGCVVQRRRKKGVACISPSPSVFLLVATEAQKE